MKRRPLGLPMTPIVRLHAEWDWMPPTKQRRSHRLVYTYREYCPLYVCQRCSRAGSGRQVQYRSGVYAAMGGRSLLCIGCWNQVRPVIRRQEAIDDLMRLQRKLMRTKHVANHR